MMLYPEKDQYTAEDLCAIVAILRDPVTGCPWDKVQTHRSIRMNFLEEAYEAVDAIDSGDAGLLQEELGDVLMQVALHAQMEAEQNAFSWNDVCDGVCRKLLLRHPHIFGAAPGLEGIKDWDAIKNREKGRLTLQEDLESVPAAMPALMRAAKLQKRAERHGQPAQDPNGLEAAVQALRAAPDPAAAGQAAGDALFALAALVSKAGIDPEQALQEANARYLRAAGEGRDHL